ncbi:hypothetical protein ERJ75_001318800 [Trypanosoma vivax]|nr:hypothetical protein TRVL_09251 [Trypanosoma vivax]KAH8608012.1 hypothetical protein ERJ75_001318500 [Trypanosoma vivax]KAH8608132.1 hypothetical protein ERJ75_001318800 [Trypanosoma vivax]
MAKSPHNVLPHAVKRSRRDGEGRGVDGRSALECRWAANSRGTFWWLRKRVVRTRRGQQLTSGSAMEAQETSGSDGEAVQKDQVDKEEKGFLRKKCQRVLKGKVWITGRSSRQPRTCTRQARTWRQSLLQWCAPLVARSAAADGYCEAKWKNIRVAASHWALSRARSPSDRE